jgi:ribosomal RNA methyltransferase Nop2
LQHDIATYFGYNIFLVGKLMKLFPVDEVSKQMYLTVWS